MKLALALAAAFGATLACAPAAAQIAPGYSGSSSTSYMDMHEYWRTLRSFGACFAKEQEAEAYELLATPNDTMQEAATFRRIVHGKGNHPCLTDTVMTVPSVLMRGTVAEALYKSGKSPPSNVVVVPPAPGVPARSLAGATRCLAVARRSDVHALVTQTSPGSRKERVALVKLDGTFRRCLPAAIRRRLFNPTEIRYRLAEALFRMPLEATP
jgi:hypothetical protein